MIHHWKLFVLCIQGNIPSYLPIIIVRAIEYLRNDHNSLIISTRGIERRMDAIERFQRSRVRRRWICWMRFTNEWSSCWYCCSSNTTTNLSSDPHFRSSLCEICESRRNDLKSFMKRNQSRESPTGLGQKKEENDRINREFDSHCSDTILAELKISDEDELKMSTWFSVIHYSVTSYII